MPATVNDRGHRLRNWGFGLGIASLWPMCVPIQLAALVVNISALVDAHKQGRPREWMTVAGLILTSVGLLVTMALIVMGVLDSTR